MRLLIYTLIWNTQLICCTVNKYLNVKPAQFVEVDGMLLKVKCVCVYIYTHIYVQIYMVEDEEDT
jgi:hypothetical protein